MFVKTATALAILLAISSNALAAQSHHRGAATSAIAAHKHPHGAAGSAYASSPPHDMCYQPPGPITLPATNPICNFRGWFMDR
jgi:hypothetical protein